MIARGVARGAILGLLGIGWLLAVGCGSKSGTSPKMQVGAKDTITKLAATERLTKGSGINESASQVKAAKETPAKAQQSPQPEKPKLDPSRITKSNFDRIDLNMSEDEVCAILGPPSSERTLDDESRELQWQTGVKSITATFRGGRLKIIDSRNLDSK